MFLQIHVSLCEKSRWRQLDALGYSAIDETCVKQVAAAAADSRRPDSSCVDVNRSGADTISSIDTNLHRPHLGGVCLLFPLDGISLCFSPFGIALFTARDSAAERSATKHFGRNAAASVIHCCYLLKQFCKQRNVETRRLAGITAGIFMLSV